MALTLEKLNIIIEGSSKDASASVDKLSASLRNLRGEARELTSYGNAVNSAIKSINKAAGGSIGAGDVGKHYKSVASEVQSATPGV